MQFRGKAVFLDWDHCLFDTDLFFNVDVWNVMQHFGITSAVWEQAMINAVAKGFTLTVFAEEIQAATNLTLPCEGLHRLFDQHFNNLCQYVFPDVIGFLKQAVEKGWERHIITFGSAEWQNYKISRSLIANDVDNVIVSAQAGQKGNLLKETTLRYEHVVVVDNNPAELDSVREHMPHAETYLINRVPDEFLISVSEEMERRFMEARIYVSRRSRYEHQRCRSLAEIDL